MPDLMIDPVAAAVAAVVAAQVMEMPAYAQRALGLGVRQDVFSEGGAILRPPVRYRRLVVWLGHAVLAVAILSLSATFFAAVARNDRLALWGVFAGAVHAVLVGVVVGAWIDLHPRHDRTTSRRRGSSTGTTGGATSSPSCSGTSCS